MSLLPLLSLPSLSLGFVHGGTGQDTPRTWRCQAPKKESLHDRLQQLDAALGLYSGKLQCGYSSDGPAQTPERESEAGEPLA